MQKLCAHTKIGVLSYPINDTIASFSVIDFVPAPQVILSSSRSSTQYLYNYDSKGTPYYNQSFAIPGISGANATAACKLNSSSSSISYFFIADSASPTIWVSAFQDSILGSPFYNTIAYNWTRSSLIQLACDGNYLYAINGDGSFYYIPRELPPSRYLNCMLN